MSALRTHPKVWLDDVLDPQGEWVEYTPAALAEGGNPGDEVVTGLGKIHGKDVGILAHNNLSNDGYITSRGAQKILKVMDLCEEIGAPILSLMSSPGVSIREGIGAGDGYARILRRTCELSGIVPQFAGMMGVNVGGPAYSATLQDIIVFNRLRSHMMVSAPNVVKSVLGQDTTLGDLGGSKMHAEVTGLAHFVEPNVKAQLQRLRALIGYFPSNHLQDPKARPASSAGPAASIPSELNTPFAMRPVLESIFDAGELHEYSPQFGTSVITMFAFLNGHQVGILANDPENLAGSLNVESSDKASRFIRICDAYNIPLITCIDTPGFMPGLDEERRGLLRSGARLCRAMQMQAPRLSVVLRKNYGAAAIVLTQTPGWGGDLVLGLEGSSSAVMGFDAARQAIYGVQDGESADLEKLKADYKENYEDPRKAYAQGYVDQILKLGEVREALTLHLQVLRQKREKKPYRVRGIEP